MQIDEIDGTTRVFAILGDPIHLVRSPGVFNGMFSRAGINAVMVAVRVPAGELAKAWSGLRSLASIEGVIVTMPHKVEALGLVDHVGDNARLVGAINAARRNADGSWSGDMFDGEGCVTGLRSQGHAIAGRSVSVTGTGGAGSAIIVALARAGAARIRVHDVDTAKRDRLLDRVRGAFPAVAFALPAPDDPPVDIAINATPLGMRAGDPLPFDPALLPAATLVVDVITKPEITPLLERAAATGHRVHPGRHMYLGQANDIAAYFGALTPGAPA
jgi:shikimate dehydrogenase